MLASTWFHPSLPPAVLAGAAGRQCPSPLHVGDCYPAVLLTMVRASDAPARTAIVRGKINLLIKVLSATVDYQNTRKT